MGNDTPGLYGTGVEQVRAFAEVGERALRVCSDRPVLKVLLYVLALVGLAGCAELPEGVGLGHLLAHDRFFLRGQLAHLVLYLGKVALLNHLAAGQQHVVEEAVFHSRAEAELYAGIEFLQCLGQQVG